MILKFLLIFLLLHYIEGKYEKTIDFIKMYIENEQKPTHLVYKLCWKNYHQLQLVREIMKIGVRSSSELGVSKHHEQEILFLVDLNCVDAEDIIFNASKRELFRSPYRWLAISQPISDQKNYSFLWDSPFLTDSDFVLAESTENGYKLSELHRAAKIRPMEVTPRGIYNGTSYVDVRPRRELYRRRRNLNGHTLVMSFVIQDSNTSKLHMEDRLEPQFDSISKMSWVNVKAVFEMLNATPSYIFTYRWGYKENGQWSGSSMIGDLETRRADVGTNCRVTPHRLEVATFIDDMAAYRIAFIFRQPPLSYVSNIFSMPFSAQVWIAFFVVCVALATAVLLLTSKHEARFGKSSSLLDGSIGDALLLIMCAVSQQGCFLEPKKASGRILVFVMFTVLMALYAAYSANIVVLLQAPSNSIRTLSQLAQSKLTLAANDKDYNYFLFKADKNDIPRTEIVKRVFPDKGKKPFYELTEGVEKIRQGLFALHSIVEPVYHHIEKTFLEIEKCSLMEVDFLNDFPGQIPLKRDSPYVEIFRVAFKQLRESGIRSATVSRLQIKRPRCTDQTASFSSAGLLNLRPVLFLMLFGFALAIFVALAEVAVFRLRKRIKSFIR